MPKFKSKLVGQGTSAIGRIAESLYVSSVKAKIHDAPSLDAEVVSVALKGEELVKVESQGDWFRVVHAEKTGWVSRLLRDAALT